MQSDDPNSTQGQEYPGNPVPPANPYPGYPPPGPNPSAPYPPPGQYPPGTPYPSAPYPPGVPYPQSAPYPPSTPYPQSTPYPPPPGNPYPGSAPFPPSAPYPPTAGQNPASGVYPAGYPYAPVSGDTSAYGPGGFPPPVSKAPRPRRNLGAIIAIVLVALLVVVGLPTTYLLLPLSATVTLTPNSLTINQNYTVNVVTSGATSTQITGRAISASSPAQTKTVPATAHSHVDAAAATGNLVFSDVQLVSGTSTSVAAGQTLVGTSGVSIITNSAFTLTVGQTTTVPAHAVNVGPSGNIPALDINFEGYIYSPNTPDVEDGTAQVTNPAAFTGGRYAQDATIVQQSDIDGASAPLITAADTAAQQALTGQTTSQLASDEQLVSNTPVCTHQVTSDHNANDVATSVTVSVTSTCSVTAYHTADLVTALTQQQQQQVTTQLGTGYVLVGKLTYQTPTGSADSTAQQLQVSASGVWGYQFSDAQKAAFAKSIVGLTPNDAATTLRRQPGVKDATVAPSGFGRYLTKNTSDLKFVVKTIPGQ